MNETLRYSVLKLTKATLLVFVTALGHAVQDRPLPKTLDEAKSWFNSDTKPTFTSPAYVPPVRPSAAENGKKRLLEGAQRMATRRGLALQIGGYASDLRADEEYRLERTDNGLTRITFSDAFWSNFFTQVNPDMSHHEYASYLLYVLLRAEADEDYLKRFNPERCAWNVQSEAETLTPSLRVLKRTMASPPTSWLSPDGPVYKTNEAFRLSLEPSGNPAKTIQALVNYGMTAMARRAADLYALEAYEKAVGESPTSRMRRRVDERERVEAWDFGRARAAMTMAERMAFRKALNNPFSVYVPDVAAATY